MGHFRWATSLAPPQGGVSFRTYSHNGSEQLESTVVLNFRAGFQISSELLLVILVVAAIILHRNINYSLVQQGAI
jgi:hypothetical protein